MSPKISIVIPVYNTEEFLPKCLDSAINQTYTNIEIIVVNDCSLGNCEEIVKSYQDSRIDYIEHDTNKGLFHARETGVQYTTGEYILHLDSDDWISRDLCRRLVQELSDMPELVLYHTNSIVKTGVERAVWTNKGIKNYDNNTFFSAICDRSFSSWAICGKLFKKDRILATYNQINNTDHLIMAEDLLFFFYYAYNCKTVRYTSYYGYNYNLTNISVNRVFYTLEKAISHLENLGIVVALIHSFAVTNKISKDHYNPIVRELAQSYFIRLIELSADDRVMIFSLLTKAFGEEIILEYISDYAQLKDNKIRSMCDIVVQKIFSKQSRYYPFVRKILLNLHSLFRKIFRKIKKNNKEK